MTSQPNRRPAAEALQVRIRIDLTSRAGDAALVAARLATALNGVASVDVVAARPCDTAAEPGPRLRLVPDPLLRIETHSRRVLLRGTPLSLTRLEFDLLHFLGEHPDRVFSRAALKAALWPRQDGNDRTVDVHVRKLRAKLEPHLDPITTIRGVGYRFEGSAPVVLT
ncbi:winged helix-turn-helix domain-containing protein [Amycolatopsis sp. NPDC004747]